MTPYLSDFFDTLQNPESLGFPGFLGSKAFQKLR